MHRLSKGVYIYLGPFDCYFYSKLTNSVTRFIFVHAEICPKKKKKKMTVKCTQYPQEWEKKTHCQSFSACGPAHSNALAGLVTGRSEEERPATLAPATRVHFQRERPLHPTRDPPFRAELFHT